jgi:hydroxyacyl-ACP dehydratase HTD2-like protein with hotdog domain
LKLSTGSELPELVKQPTTRQLVQYAGASGDFYEIHYDQDVARSTGLPGVILHGLLKAAYLGQLITDWGGRDVGLKTLEVSYRGIDQPGRPYRCRGRIASVDGNQAEVEIWGEDEAGNRTTLGSATVELVA